VRPEGSGELGEKIRWHHRDLSPWPSGFVVTEVRGMSRTDGRCWCAWSMVGSAPQFRAERGVCNAVRNQSPPSASSRPQMSRLFSTAHDPGRGCVVVGSRMPRIACSEVRSCSSCCWLGTPRIYFRPAFLVMEKWKEPFDITFLSVWLFRIFFMFSVPTLIVFAPLCTPNSSMQPLVVWVPGVKLVGASSWLLTSIYCWG
jgi:hypothetical protein